MFFDDDREPYRQADEASFWELGERDLDHVLGTSARASRRATR
jgi:hypothetical protein